jgi:hypothetical protein
MFILYVLNICNYGDIHQENVDMAVSFNMDDNE